MDIIHLLPDSVANQIAAGEVVQRPSSVIKELMENAIDAGALNVDVLVEDAGRTSIQVIDDGKGMSPTDARMAFERHATSKIHKAEDLFTLSTMGFRGEALACILIVFGGPVAISSFPMAQQMDCDEEIAANVVFFSSFLCIFTLFCWIFILSTLRLF
jgi:DNA mismatch repair protein MutL